MNNGWVKIHRKILDNPISTKPNWAWLWVVILLKANHEEVKMIWNGKVTTIKRGQFITSRDKLAIASGLHSSSVERCLKFLEIEHQIEQQKTTKYRLITILKWGQHQKADSKTDNKRTTDEQQMNTNKNDKNVKNDKNNTLSAKADEFSFEEELEKLKKNENRKDLKIIALYWKKKGFIFENREQFSSALKRELRPAKSLVGYSGEQIAKSMNYCIKEYPDIYTLETVGKRISDLINKK